MGLIEQSSNAAEVLKDAPLLAARIEIAVQRLRMDIAQELMAMGRVPDNLAIELVVAGLPEDVYNREVAARA